MGGIELVDRAPVPLASAMEQLRTGASGMAGLPTDLHRTLGKDAALSGLCFLI